MSHTRKALLSGLAAGAIAAFGLTTAVMVPANAATQVVDVAAVPIVTMNQPGWYSFQSTAPQLTADGLVFNDWDQAVNQLTTPITTNAEGVADAFHSFSLNADRKMLRTVTFEVGSNRDRASVTSSPDDASMNQWNIASSNPALSGTGLDAVSAALKLTQAGTTTITGIELKAIYPTTVQSVTFRGTMYRFTENARPPQPEPVTVTEGRLDLSVDCSALTVTETLIPPTIRDYVWDAAALEWKLGPEITGTPQVTTRSATSAECELGVPKNLIQTQSAKAGESIQVLGTGFTPGDEVSVYFGDDRERLGLLTVDPMGQVQASVWLPQDTTPGTYEVWLEADGVKYPTANRITVLGGQPTNPGDGGTTDPGNGNGGTTSPGDGDGSTGPGTNPGDGGPGNGGTTSPGDGDGNGGEQGAGDGSALTSETDELAYTGQNLQTGGLTVGAGALLVAGATTLLVRRRLNQKAA